MAESCQGSHAKTVMPAEHDLQACLSLHCSQVDYLLMEVVSGIAQECGVLMSGL